MSQMTDDSGAAAVSVTQELQDLRHACDRLDIKWHWRHKATSLIRMIQDNEDQAKPQNTVEVELIAVADNGAPDSTSIKPVRQIPHDVESALEYMMSYKRANAKLVRSFIESLL